MASDVGDLVVLLGDFHIPHRAAGIPEEFKELLQPHRVHHVLCTGNLCSKGTEEYLRSLANSVHIVGGDFDDASLNLPQSKVVEIRGLKIGLSHGHQVVPWGDDLSLSNLRRELDVDVLVTGHTGKLSLKQDGKDNKFLINPGSVTGAYVAHSAVPTQPSFMLLAIKDDSFTAYTYVLKDGNVALGRVTYQRNNGDE